MSNLILKGKINAIFDSEIRTNFEKRVFWLDVPGTSFMNTYSLECHQNDCNILDNFRAGDAVIVHVDVRGKLWSKAGKDSVFNTLKAWKIERDVSVASAPTAAQQAPPKPAATPTQQRSTIPQTRIDEDDALDDAPF